LTRSCPNVVSIRVEPSSGGDGSMSKDALISAPSVFRTTRQFHAHKRDVLGDWQAGKFSGGRE